MSDMLIDCVLSVKRPLDGMLCCTCFWSAVLAISCTIKLVVQQPKGYAPQTPLSNQPKPGSSSEESCQNRAAVRGWFCGAFLLRLSRSCAGRTREPPSAPALAIRPPPACVALLILNHYIITATAWSSGSRGCSECGPFVLLPWRCCLVALLHVILCCSCTCPTLQVYRSVRGGRAGAVYMWLIPVWVCHDPRLLFFANGRLGLA